MSAGWIGVLLDGVAESLRGFVPQAGGQQKVMRHRLGQHHSGVRRTDTQCALTLADLVRISAEFSCPGTVLVGVSGVHLRQPVSDSGGDDVAVPSS